MLAISVQDSKPRIPFALKKLLFSFAALSLAASTSFAQSPSPTPATALDPIFHFPTPNQCTSTELPRAPLCRALPGQTVNCVDYAQSYCKYFRSLNYKAWTIGIKVDPSSCEGGRAFMKLLLDYGCAKYNSTTKNVEIDGACIDRYNILGGHALNVVKTLDERLKGSYAEFTVTEPQLNGGITRFISYSPEAYDPDLTAEAINTIREIYFPVFHRYGIPIQIIKGDPCSVSRVQPTYFNFNGKTILMGK